MGAETTPIAPYGPRLVLHAVDGPLWLVRRHKRSRPDDLIDIEVVEVVETDDLVGYSDTFFDIYCDDIVYTDPWDDMPPVTRSFMFNAQVMVAPLDGMKAATLADVMEALSTVDVNDEDGEVNLAADLVIPIIPNWVMGRMGMCGSRTTRRFPSRTMTLAEQYDLDPYVWATCNNRCDVGPNVCLMPDGTAYELIVGTPPKKVKVEVKRPEDVDSVLFLQVGWIGGGIRRAYGVGV